MYILLITISNKCTYLLILMYLISICIQKMYYGVLINYKQNCKPIEYYSSNKLITLFITFNCILRINLTIII